MATNTTPAAASSSASNESIIYTWLRNFGFTAPQAAGVLGNLQTESGFNPASYNAKEGAQGIAQWEGGRGDQGGLGAYAAAHPTLGGVAALPTQLGYLGQELNGPYARAVAAVKQTSSPAAAAQAWATMFEGNNPASDGARENNATAIYSQIQAGQPLTGGPSSSTSNITQATDTAYSSKNPPPAGGFTSDQQFQQWANSTFGSITGPGTALESAFGSALGGAASGVASEVESWAEDIFHALFTFLVNALCVIVGLICIYQGFKMMSDAEESGGDAAEPTPEQEPSKEDEAAALAAA